MYIALVFLLIASFSQAAKLEFVSEELFRIPFGSARDQLGTKTENGQFLIPRTFSMDSKGRFYVNDVYKHRVARFSPNGRYELGVGYIPTAKQVFSHADSQDHLWVLVTDPSRGFYSGVYDSRGMLLRETIFSQFNTFQFHVADDGLLHVILSSTKTPSYSQRFFLDQESQRLKKLDMAKPSDTHHKIQQNGKTFSVDVVPGATASGGAPVQRIRDEAHKPIADIQGHVIYITEAGEIYTRVPPCEIRLYDVSGSLQSRFKLSGLPATCDSLRFDAWGNFYQMDGIPNARGEYEESMSGVRLIRWLRQ